MSEVKLRNCHCCGGKSRFVVDHEHVNINCETEIYGYVMCNECGLEQRELSTKNEAINAWNTRKPMDDVVERLEECEEYEAEAHNYNASTAFNKAIEIVKGGVED